VAEDDRLHPRGRQLRDELGGRSDALHDPIALALAKREVSEHDLRLGGRLPITRSEKLVARFRQHVLPCALGLEARLSIAEKKPRPGRVVLGPELERVRVEAGSGSESVAWASEPQTQFNGSFVFARPLCAHFELQVEGRPEPIPFALPFGKPC